MITIELTGGLGNQMFQYALAVKFTSLKRKVQIISMFEKDSLRHFELGCFEGIKSSDIPIFDKHSAKAVNENPIKSFISKVHSKYTRSYSDIVYTFQPKIFRFWNAHLCGYWQNEKYFSNIRPQILEIYRFDEAMIHSWNNAISSCYPEGIYPENEFSISVHVRRTDYTDAKNISLYDGICTIEYYCNAINYFLKLNNNAVFYFFSDDIKWVEKELLPKINKTVLMNYHIINTKCDDSAIDMWIMTRCRHHIVANSTYSWWGAWLGDNDDKIVISPSKWVNGYPNDIICNDWIMM